MSVVFVDERNEVVGSGTIQEALEKGLYLRISRVVLLNSRGQMLLQQRSKHVFLPLKWNESAAGHVDKDETHLETALRELKEEIGVDNVTLVKFGDFFLEEIFDDGKVKKSFNSVYTLVYDGDFILDPKEVEQIQWFECDEVAQWTLSKPHDFTLGGKKAIELFLTKQK